MIQTFQPFATILLTFCISASGEEAQTPLDNQDTVHVFPQFADGVVAGSNLSYRSTLTVSAVEFVNSTVCTFRLLGLPATAMTDVRGSTVLNTVFNFTLGSSGWQIIRSTGTQPLASGSAVLECNRLVAAELRYSFLAGSHVTSETTVFPASPGRLLQLVADHRNGTRVALALANPSAFWATHTITALDIEGRTVGRRLVQIPPASSLARFIDEWIPASFSEHVGQVLIEANSPGVDAYGIGIRHSGEVFSAIPTTTRIR